MVSLIAFGGLLYTTNFGASQTSTGPYPHANILSNTDYLQDYPVTDYVSENLESSMIFHDSILYSIINSEDVLSEEDYFWEALKLGAFSVIKAPNYSDFIHAKQYEETKPVTLISDVGNYSYNYIYTGVDKNGDEHTGKLALFEYEGDIALALSFLDDDGNPDPALADIMSDDSNAEVLAYQIIYELQTYFGDNLEPNNACEKYFGINIEQLAGSISYHALATSYIIENGGSDKVLNHTEVVNIFKSDRDGFFVNRSL